MWTYRGTDYNNDYLAHHGILGQKWGVRRFQNPDGTLTAAGRERYLGANSEHTISKYKKLMKEEDREYSDDTKRSVSEMHDARLTYKQNKTKENKIALKQAKNKAFEKLRMETGKANYEKGETSASLLLKSLGRNTLRAVGLLGASVAIGAGIGGLSRVLGLSGATAQTIALIASIPVSVIGGYKMRKDTVTSFYKSRALRDYTREKEFVKSN